MWSKTDEVKGEIDKSTVTGDNFSTTDRTTREKNCEDIEDLNNIINLICNQYL